ncbi:MAG: hypothetical protein DLM64_02530 [Solirubrobacterales bacterium]|nr:MAG: hypothetical protein DLM64_02530 [Solirubrobacterales bacterium]
MDGVISMPETVVLLAYGELGDPGGLELPDTAAALPRAHFLATSERHQLVLEGAFGGRQEPVT